MNLPVLRWLTPAALLLWAALVQAQATPIAPAAPVAQPSVAIQPSLAYRSVIKAYKPYADASVTSWRAANDTTAQVGGWRTYAKEAQQPDGPGKGASDAQDATKPIPNSPGGRP